MDNITIFLHTDNGDVPIELDLDTFRELAGWLYNRKYPEVMTLAESAMLLVDLATIVGGEMIKQRHLHSGGRLMWAASTVRQHIEAQERKNGKSRSG